MRYEAGSVAQTYTFLSYCLEAGMHQHGWNFLSEFDRHYIQTYIDKKKERKRKEKIRFDEMKKRPIVNEYKLSLIDKCQCSNTCQNYMKAIEKKKRIRKK
jgi:hypothetical protein